MLRVIRVVACSACAMLAMACTVNPFLTNYAGRREAAVEGPRVVTAPPAEGPATELGTSEFLSSSESDGTAEALAAAADVGADLVMVTKAEATVEDCAARPGRGTYDEKCPCPDRASAGSSRHATGEPRSEPRAGGQRRRRLAPVTAASAKSAAGLGMGTAMRTSESPP
ncbi:MAG: hypothetical protein ACKOV8_05445 [Phycisphaerales bacterium]